MKHWYALYTKPYKEPQVRSSLKSKGYETYLPTIEATTDEVPRALDAVETLSAPVLINRETTWSLNLL